MWVDEAAGDPLVVFTERPIGGGASGSVFEGWYLGALVAVKRMSELEKQAAKELVSDRPCPPHTFRRTSQITIELFDCEFTYLLMKRAIAWLRCGRTSTGTRARTGTRTWSLCTG